MFSDTLASASALTTSDPGLPHTNPTQPFWQEPAHALFNVQSPALAPSADIVIIGSGITGCSIAKHILENSDLSVVVLEARNLCSGATGQ